MKFTLAFVAAIAAINVSANAQVDIKERLRELRNFENVDHDVSNSGFSCHSYGTSYCAFNCDSHFEHGISHHDVFCCLYCIYHGLLL